jgi:hypothetical protein
MNQVLHYGVANLTPFQIRSPNSSPNNNLGKMIETTLHTSKCTKNDAKKGESTLRWLNFSGLKSLSKVLF